MASIPKVDNQKQDKNEAHNIATEVIKVIKYTANVLTIKTTGTGNCRGPAGKIRTIYRKGL